MNAPIWISAGSDALSGRLAWVPWAVAAGIGATAVMDGLGWLQRWAFGAPSPDYGLVGRWLGHLLRGTVRHGAITRAAPIPAERVIGWTAHYLIGMAFASLMPAVWGLPWTCHPSPGPALAVGVATVALPFLVMQPAMGLGVAASRTADAARRRLRSLVAHLSYGVGLYVAAFVLAHAVRSWAC